MNLSPFLPLVMKLFLMTFLPNVTKEIIIYNDHCGSLVRSDDFESDFCPTRLNDLSLADPAIPQDPINAPDNPELLTMLNI